jgi:hypothetical protein
LPVWSMDNARERMRDEWSEWAGAARAWADGDARRSLGR